MGLFGLFRRGQSSRVEAPDELRGWVIRALAGALAATVAVGVSRASGVVANDASVSAVQQALALAGLLLVPAAIFTAVIGAMFPNYWKATPQALIRFSPHGRLLTILAVTVGYGIAASVWALVWSPTWVVAAPLLALVGAGAVAVIRLIGHSLAIIDPLRLGEMIREWGEQDPANAIVAFNDLCRLTRGMKERERRDVVKATVRHMRTLWERHGAAVELNRALAERVLGEVDRCWGQSDMRAETDACRRTIGPVESP